MRSAQTYSRGATFPWWAGSPKTQNHQFSLLCGGQKCAKTQLLGGSGAPKNTGPHPPAPLPLPDASGRLSLSLSLSPLVRAIGRRRWLFSTEFCTWHRRRSRLAFFRRFLFIGEVAPQALPSAIRLAQVLRLRWPLRGPPGGEVDLAAGGGGERVEVRLPGAPAQLRLLGPLAPG